jgi:hypothetical protein
MPATDTAQTRDATPRLQLILTAVFAALYAAARLRHLTATCLWFDEIFSVHAARHAWGELWRFAAADLIHPPLFYALLKIWIAAGGESLLWLRLFPALTSIAALVPFLLLARELRLGASATNVALLLMAANGYLIKYAQEVRMYSLLLLLTLFSLWLFARLLSARSLPDATRGAFRLQLALAFVNLLLIYTHYYGWLVVACEAVFLVFKDRHKLRVFLPSSAALALLFVPWVALCAREAGAGGGLAQNIGWIARPGARDLWQFFALLDEPFYFRQSSVESLYARGGAVLALVLVGLPVALLFLKTLKRRRHEPASRVEDERSTSAGDKLETHDDDARLRSGEDDAGADDLLFLSLFTLLPVALAFAASYLLPESVWGERHLIVVAVPYALLAGVALTSLRPAWLKSAALVVLCCWFTLAGALTLVGRDENYIWCAWENLAASAARDEAQAEADAQADARGASGFDVRADTNSNGGARPTSGFDERRAGGFGPRPVKVFAFEDLVAYHLWFALDGARQNRFQVAVVKQLPGVAEDRAYFLPRRFDGVAKVSGADALGGERFFAAFRDTAWDESHEPLKTILERGYRAERVYETEAQGQRAFFVLFARARVSADARAAHFMSRSNQHQEVIK